MCQALFFRKHTSALTHTSKPVAQMMLFGTTFQLSTRVTRPATPLHVHFMLDAVFGDDTLLGDALYSLGNRFDIVFAQGLEETIARCGSTTANREGRD
jgi:hypothetical protein